MNACTIVAGSSRDYFESHIRKVGPGFAATMNALRNPIQVVHTHGAGQTTVSPASVQPIQPAAAQSRFDAYA